MSDSSNAEPSAETSSVSELPKGWCWANFVKIAEASKNALKAGPFGSALKKEYYVSSGYKIYGQEQVIREDPFYGDYYIDHQKYKSLESCAVKPGDILISLVGTIGKVLILPEGIEAGIINPRLVKLSLEEILAIPEFIKNYLESSEVRYYFSSLSHGGTMDILNLTTLKTLPIPLPPLNEQRRVVAKLDSLFARSRRAREELERIPKLCDRYKQAILAAAFRGDLTADWRKENNSKPLLEDRTLIDGRLPDLLNLPNEWVWANVSHVASVTGGLTKNQSRTSLEKKAPYLRVANVYANELRLDDIAEIGIADSEWKRVKLKAGDLLIVEGNGSLEQIGRVALWHGEIEPCAHQNHLIKLRVKNIISPKFALYWLLSPGGRRAIEQVASSSAGLHTLSISKVSALPIPLCAVQEMEVVVERIEKLFKAIDLMAQEYQKASKLCDRLEQATLAKAFRGELVPQDPNDEPAAALLERLQAENSTQTKGKSVKSKQRSGEQS